MFCTGARITFGDGRIAAARNADELEKIFGMTSEFSAVNCFADSIGLEAAALSGNSGQFVYENRDNGEKYSVDAKSLDDVKKISTYFLRSGEREPSFDWVKQ